MASMSLKPDGKLPPGTLDQQRVVRAFFHHLHDTLVLLGADAKLADLVESPEVIGAGHVDELRRYNGKLIDETKSKLVNINKLAVVTDD
jgi:hypothetical protein